MGRPLHQHRTQTALGTAGSPQRLDRPLGAFLPAHGRTAPGDRLLTGKPALVGLLAEGPQNRNYGRADAAGMDAGSRPAAAAGDGMAGTLGRGIKLASTRPLREDLHTQRKPPGGDA